MFDTTLEKFIDKKRKEIPEQYNQAILFGQLTNDDLDWYIEITNRTDGKTYNYLHIAMLIAIKYDVKFTLLARHYTVRLSYMGTLKEIVDDPACKDIDGKKLTFKRTDDYIIVAYDSKAIGIITDLNSATDLKYVSTFLKQFPIIIYDEFLALEGDYLPDEWERFKTIYMSIDRNGDIPLIKYPKIFLLGNAVNFSSPFLANLELFNKIENQEINTTKQYNNILLSILKNPHAVKKQNTRAFPEIENDSMLTAEFNYNKEFLISDTIYDRLISHSDSFIIKLRNHFMKVTFNLDDYDILLELVQYSSEYQFCTEIIDIKENCIFLKESYYSDREQKKFTKGRYWFKNSYSKDMIVKDYNVMSIKVMKVVSAYINSQIKRNEIKRIEQVEKDMYIEKSLKAIGQKFGIR